MSVALRLLGNVCWQDQPVVGDRPQALLAALATAGGRPLGRDELIELVWGERPDDGATKRLQVLVSRTRAALDGEAILRDGGGYRLGVGADDVDVLRLHSLVGHAAAALDRDPAHAVTLADQALALGPAGSASESDGGPLAELRRQASEDLTSAQVIRARASGRTGASAGSLAALDAAHEANPRDEALLADLLRAEAVARGPAAALERYESHRRRLRDELGAAPGLQLQAVQRDLLALDRPVRTGVRQDPTPLLGRDADLARLRGLLATARVVSIIGPGGLGKTRLAHAVARGASAAAVHVVELVNVAAPEDVIGEVGAVLGVRDSLGTRRALTPDQRADLRSRIVQRLALVPSLLVLDNCEHVVQAVAELVAVLVSGTPGLQVLTTSRSPLAIAAEQVYQLGQLGLDDAGRLFGERAVAARPGVRLDDSVTGRIVARLDGLPLAIELAAARVRVMDVHEIDRRLEDRFSLLRGGDRSAPDRHQTLLAVIDWSWQLLGPVEQRALRRLALFNAGFTLQSADAVLGEDSMEAVQGLLDQSLLSTEESRYGLRYRMLETVREFGRLQLAQAGEEAQARAARREWAIAYAERYGGDVWGPRQFAAVDGLAAEESELADELRAALGDGDRGGAVRLLASLGAFWAVRGSHARVAVLIDAVAESLRNWQPPAELTPTTRAAVTIVFIHAVVTNHAHLGLFHALLRRLGPGAEDHPALAGMVHVVLAFEPDDPEGFVDRLQELTADPRPEIAWPAWQWLSFARENTGDPAGAIEAAEQALALMTGSEGPWSEAILRAQLAQLTMHLGDRPDAAEHARAALPVMRRLGAIDDEVQLRCLLALGAIAGGRLDEARAELDHDEDVEDSEVFGGVAMRQIGRAELAIAEGETGDGLARYREAVAQMEVLRFADQDPTGDEPWILFGVATALTAHAHYAATDEELGAGRSLFAAGRSRALQTMVPGNPQFDFPVDGLLMLALGTWALLRTDEPPELAVDLLALAERFAYNRAIPTMSWERIAPAAEAAVPGGLDARRPEYATRRPADLIEEARRAVERLSGRSENPRGPAVGGHIGRRRHP